MDITVSEDIDAEFLEEVEIILKDGEFKKLSRYIQHKNTTRLMHSINVSYISWVIAKRQGATPGRRHVQAYCMTSACSILTESRNRGSSGIPSSQSCGKKKSGAF